MRWNNCPNKSHNAAKHSGCSRFQDPVNIIRAALTSKNKQNVIAKDIAQTWKWGLRKATSSTVVW